MVACEAEMRTAGPPAGIRLSLDRGTLTAVPGDVAHVTFEIVDSAGTVVPTSDTLVAFTVTGGSILVLDNANLSDHDSYRSDRRHAFNGRGLAILGASQPGRARLTASANGLAPASLSVRVVGGEALKAVPAAAP